MMRTITVKGIGRVSTPPDYVVISMTLESKALEYEISMEQAAEKIAQTNASLEAVGFEPKSIKTTSFDVRTEYDHEKDRYGNYKSVFSGYVCRQRLKVEFDFDTKRLAQTLYAISKCLAEPEISISFTVKDPAAVNTELLRSATENAREKAKILCEASNVQLGSLLSIDYNWGELNIVSKTNYVLEERCMAMPCDGLADIDIEPDDIDVSDTATFVWEIQ